MTKHELRAFRNRAKEIKQLNRQLVSLINLAAPTAHYGGGGIEKSSNGSPVENAVEKIVMLSNIYEQALNDYAAERLKIEKAFDVLSPDERIIMRDYYFENLTWEQIAELDDISYRHVHRLHSHALQVLREQ